MTNRERLLEQGVYYPEIGAVSSAHHLIAAALHPNAHRLHEDTFAASDLQRADLFQKYVADVFDGAHAAGADSILLSSEYLWGFFDESLYAGWCSALTRASKVKIIAVLRRQDNWVQSTYMQAVKYGEARSFSDWYAEYKDRLHAGVSYLKTLDGWRKAFGWGSVKAYVYENLIQSGDVCAAFIESVFRSSISTDGFEVLDRPENPSPSPETLELLLAVNRSDMTDHHKANVRHLLMMHGGRRLVGRGVAVLPPSERLDILKRTARENNIILFKYAAKKTRRLFGQPWPK